MFFVVSVVVAFFSIVSFAVGAALGRHIGREEMASEVAKWAEPDEEERPPWYSVLGPTSVERN